MAINSQRIRLITILLICVMSMMFVALSNGAVQHKGAHREPTKIRAKSGRIYILYPKAVPAPPGPTGVKASASTKKVVMSVMPAVPLWLIWRDTSGAYLEWARNAEPEVVGYRVYIGTSSGIYNSALDCGNEILAEIPLAVGTYYFALTAYDNLGRESNYSEEVWYTQPETRHLLVSLVRSGPPPPPTGVFIVQSKDSPEKPWSYYITTTNSFVPLSATTPKLFRVGRKP